MAASRRAAKTAPAPAKPDFDTLLATAKLPETTVPVCLRADLAADHEAAEAELDRLLKEPPTSLAGNGASEVADRIRELEVAMKAAEYPFRLRALPRPKWRAFVAAHQPRRGDDGEVDERDAKLGVNVDTFFDALIRICLIDPSNVDDARWADLNEKLTDAQYELLSSAAWSLNRRDVDVPFSRAAWRLTETSVTE